MCIKCEILTKRLALCIKEMKDIKSFEGLYAITRNGKVWSYPNKKGGSKNGKWLRVFIQHRGYYNYYLQHKNKRRIILAHKLVANAYIPNPLNRKEINHINGNKLDNRVENLEWSTRSENMKHAYKLGLLHKFGKHENHPMAKLNKKQVLQIRESYKSGEYTQRQLAKQFKVNQRLIWSIIHNEIWKFN